jgi:hypothetical protein
MSILITADESKQKIGLTLRFHDVECEHAFEMQSTGDNTFFVYINETRKLKEYRVKEDFGLQLVTSRFVEHPEVKGDERFFFGKPFVQKQVSSSEAFELNETEEAITLLSPRKKNRIYRDEAQDLRIFAKNTWGMQHIGTTAYHILRDFNSTVLRNGVAGSPIYDTYDQSARYFKLDGSTYVVYPDTTDRSIDIMRAKETEDEGQTSSYNIRGLLMGFVACSTYAVLHVKRCRRGVDQHSFVLITEGK